jgi:hypothetical protein
LKRKFNFDLYRLNIVDIEDLFIETDVLRVRGNADLLKIIGNACASDFDEEQETRNTLYKWSLRYFENYINILPERNIISVVLARSVLEKDGLIVTDDGISSGSSMSTPPLASTMILFFDMQRHLVAVEHSGDLSQVAWKDFLEKILSNVALSLDKESIIKLEPVPEKHKILALFRSFDRLTRIKVTLRIPNPELTRYTQHLFDDLRQSDIREYSQDMKNPNGLSKSEISRPFASAALAQQGYKDGDVHMEGFRNDNYEKVISSSTATRGSINSLKDFVRGLKANAKTKEIDRIHPIELEADNEG